MWVIKRKSSLGKGNSGNEGQCFADGVMEAQREKGVKDDSKVFDLAGYNETPMC